jgi:hypothetical protein
MTDNDDRIYELHLSSDDDKDHVEELAKFLQQVIEGEND